jgi:hypothetical protein
MRPWVSVWRQYQFLSNRVRSCFRLTYGTAGIFLRGTHVTVSFQLCILRVSRIISTRFLMSDLFRAFVRIIHPFLAISVQVVSLDESQNKVMLAPRFTTIIFPLSWSFHHLTEGTTSYMPFNVFRHRLPPKHLWSRVAHSVAPWLQAMEYHVD